VEALELLVGEAREDQLRARQGEHERGQQLGIDPRRRDVRGRQHRGRLSDRIRHQQPQHPLRRS